MSRSTKLRGIELCRGLAAFAVILVHSGDQSWDIPIDDSAIEFRLLFYFAVPFFIATYFYLTTKKLPERISFSFWRKKLKRIVIPYFFWSTIFLLLKSVLSIRGGNIDQLKQLWSDPLAIVLFGAASYHLYFLPLLMSGTLLLYSAKYIVKHQNSFWIICLGYLLSTLFYQWLVISDNIFTLGEYVAFPQLLNLLSPQTFSYSIVRIILVCFAWIFRCLPYFFVALFLNHTFKIGNHRWLYYRQTSLCLMLGFILLNAIEEKLMFRSFTDVAIAYSLLLFGISISKRISNNWLIDSLGICSFGIYLIHPFIKSIIEPALTISIPSVMSSVSIVSMMIIACSTFIVSWIVVSLLRRHKLLANFV